MSLRLHILITERQHAVLVAEADRTGLPVAELVRRAIDEAFRRQLRPKTGGFEVSLGLWRRPDAAAAARRPGIRLVG